MPALDTGPTSPSTLCGSWVEDIDAVCPCGPCDFSPEGDDYCIEGAIVLERWCLIASGLLYAFSGRQFPGVCSDTIRPCSSTPGGVVQSLDYAASGGSRPIVYQNGGSCNDSALGCCGHSSVLLPHKPVRRILEVEIDGATVPSTDYTLVDRRWLVKASGSWPCHQNLGLPDGEPDTWSVSYEYGIPAPAGGAEMAGIYACELAKGCAGDESCRLPRRVQSITREGITQVLIDPFDFLDQGKTGLYEVDAWLRAQNPEGRSRAGKIINVDLLGSDHRVR